MVSFFGFKFGADKKKKEPEPAENSLYAQQWKASREEVLRQASGMPGSSTRPGTAQGSLKGSLKGGAKSHTSIGSDSIRDSETRGSGAGFLGTSTSVTALPGPLTSHSLKPYASEANLKTNLGAMNSSSSSLATARLPLGGIGSDIGPRPGSAHSARQGRPGSGPGQAKPSLSPLDVHIMRESTPGSAGPSRSPLGQFELMSPVSDNESLLGEEPDKIAKEISNRITQEEEQTKSKAEDEERNRVQAEMRAQAMRNVDASSPNTVKGYPSPPDSIASIQADRDVTSALAPGQKSNAILGGPISHDLRPGSSGRAVPNGPLRPATGPPRIQQPTMERGRSDSRGRPPPSIEKPLPTPREPPRGTSAGSDPRSVSRGRSQTADNLTPGSSLLRPQGSREPPVRGATVPAVRPPPRSPLAQQSKPFDLPKVNELRGDDNKLTVDYRPSHDRYGIPSPPLSNSQCSGEEVDNRPVIQTVQAKRDTLIIGADRRGSLGLQIDEFEKTLQQAQAMTALEKGPADVDNVGGGGGARSRGNSEGSSNYSDISESPMTIEPPLISPQPFPLTPRPMSPATRSSKPNLADIIGPTRRPTLEERPESSSGSSRSSTTPVGSIRSNTADGMRPIRPVLQIRPESPAYRPRLNGTAAPRRPTLEEYGIRINTVGSMDSRIGQPSPDGLDARLNRAESPDRIDSPILKNVRNVFSPEQMSEAPSSAHTSRSSSPIAHHSVFSPPPPAKRPLPPRTVKTEWNLGPAPTAPPTTPLPIPEKNFRRKPADRSQSPLPPTPTRLSPTHPAGLASSASIVPDMLNNPNWPLPGPRSSSSGSVEGGSFSARRSLLPDRRAPPAPLNIAATKYADDVAVADPGSALDVVKGDDEGAAIGLTPIMQPQTAGGYKEVGEGVARWRDSLGMGDEGFVWRDERTTVYNTAEGDGDANEDDDEEEEEDEGDVFEQPPAAPAYGVRDKSFAIGVARGPSIKYDQAREQEKRARARDRMIAMRVGGGGPGLMMSPPGRGAGGAGDLGLEKQRQQSAERLRTAAMNGLRSPTGVADEHGTGFI